jgi:hypothetical protein
MTDNRYVDRYGFLSSKTINFDSEEALKENARLEKWQNMLSKWVKYKSRRQNKLKSRVRKGIPDSLRGIVWCDFAEIKKLKEQYPSNLYFSLIADDEDEHDKTTNEIKRDLARTFPAHVLFRAENGRESLNNVLKAYSKFDPPVGYCQGMGFIVALFLMYMEEESAFWLLASCIKKYEMAGYFIQCMPKVNLSLQTARALLKHYLPKLWRHFENIGVCPSMFAPQWFMTVYSSNFPMECVVRIWDVYLYEGPKIVYRIFLAVMKLHYKQLKKLPFENLLSFIREAIPRIQADELINAAFSFNLSRKRIHSTEEEVQSELNSKRATKL